MVRTQSGETTARVISFPGRGRGAPAQAMPTTRLGRETKLAALPVAYAGRRAVGLGKRMTGKPAAQIELDIHLRTAEHLVDVLGELKGCLAKIGQMAAMYRSVLPSIVPREFAEVVGTALSRLQDSAPPMLPGLVHQVLARNLGPEWRTRFREFDDRPAAAASLGQVHHAVWHDGREVAVKIMFPGGHEAVAADLKLLRSLSGVIGALLPGADVRAIVEMVCALVVDELDYPREAATQQLVADALAGDPEFVVPSVLAHTGEVLISEWLRGTPVSRLVVTAAPAERSRLGLASVRFIETVRHRCHLLYTDVHPGNFLLLPDGRLGVVDFGACEPYPRGFPRMVVEIGDALYNGTPADVEAALRAHGFVRPDADFEVRELLRIVAPFLDVLLRDDFRLSDDWLRAQVATITEIRLSNVFRQMTLPPELTAMARTLVTGFGLLCQLGTDGIRGELLSWWGGLAEIVRRHEERAAAGTLGTVRSQDLSAAEGSADDRDPPPGFGRAQLPHDTQIGGLGPAAVVAFQHRRDFR